MLPFLPKDPVSLDNLPLCHWEPALVEDFDCSESVFNLLPSFSNLGCK